jgi:hypothetical protein
MQAVTELQVLIMVHLILAVLQVVEPEQHKPVAMEMLRYRIMLQLTGMEEQQVEEKGAMVHDRLVEQQPGQPGQHLVVVVAVPLVTIVVVQQGGQAHEEKLE